MKSRPGRCCDQQSQVGAACRFPWYHELVELILQSMDIDGTTGPGGHAGRSAHCILACACSGVLWLTPSSMNSALLIKFNAHHPLIHVEFTFPKAITYKVASLVGLLLLAS